MSCSSSIHVSHVNTSDGRFPLVQSLNIFKLVRWEFPAKHLRVWGNGKSGWNKQEQCIIWIPLQCGVLDAKRTNSYLGHDLEDWGKPWQWHTPENGQPFQMRLNLRHSPLIEGECNELFSPAGLASQVLFARTSWESASIFYKMTMM